MSALPPSNLWNDGFIRFRVFAIVDTPARPLDYYGRQNKFLVKKGDQKVESPTQWAGFQAKKRPESKKH